MSDRVPPVQTEGERGRAVLRLKEAVSRQRSLLDAHEAAKGTRDEPAVNAALSVAGDDVAARERWLRSVDDHDY